MTQLQSRSIITDQRLDTSPLRTVLLLKLRQMVRMLSAEEYLMTTQTTTGECKRLESGIVFSLMMRWQSWAILIALFLYQRI
jgi:hypothetical protein